MRKKLLSGFLAASMALGCGVPQTVQCLTTFAYAEETEAPETPETPDVPDEELESEGFRYKVNEDGETVTVTKYTGTETEATVPDEIDGKTVTVIGTRAFSENAALEKVNFGSKLELISKYAFENCTALERIIVPGSVKTIGNNAFSGCTTLAKAELAEGVESIEAEAFGSCTSLADITIPESVIFVGIEAFTDTPWYDELLNSSEGLVVAGSVLLQYNGSATEVDLPDSIKVIGGFAFSSSNAEIVNIPSSVEYISDYAFSDSKLTDIYIPDSVKEIGYGAFSKCKEAVSVKLSESLTELPNFMFAYSPKIEKVTIPDSVTTIGDQAFWGCKSLKSVTFGKGLTTIKEQAFLECEGLKSIELPDSVQFIDTVAFYGCTALESVKLPHVIADSDLKHVFYECENLTELIIPHGAKNIEGLFGGCKKLETVVIPSSVTDLGEKFTFDNCDSLKTIKFTGTEEQWKAILNLDKWEEFLAGVEIEFEFRLPAEYHTYVPEVTKEPTCEKDGLKSFTCVCGDSYTETISMTGHSFGDWTVVTPKTCLTDGLEVRICPSCKKSETNVLKAEGHKEVSAGNEVTLTCTKDGKTSDTICSECNAILKVGIISKAQGHKYGDVTYTWSEDNKNCTAVRVCPVCKGKETETAKATTKTVAPTYTEKGKKTFTAKFKNPQLETQVAAVETTDPKKTLSYPTIVEMSASTSNSVTIEWSDVVDASGYEIEKYDASAKKWSPVKTVNAATTTYKATGLKAGTDVKFRVRAYVKEGANKAYSSYKSISAVTKPSKIASLKIKAKKKTTMTLSWKKNTTATGYRIQHYSGGKWITLKTTAKNTTTSLKIKKLKKNTTYKFRVAAYTTVGGKNYYGASVSVKGKTKK